MEAPHTILRLRHQLPCSLRNSPPHGGHPAHLHCTAFQAPHLSSNTGLRLCRKSTLPRSVTRWMEGPTEIFSMLQGCAGRVGQGGEVLTGSTQGRPRKHWLIWKPRGSSCSLLGATHGSLLTSAW